MKADVALMVGLALETHRGDFYTVALERGARVLARRVGRLILYKIRVIAGDAVVVELSARDARRGRITRRL